MSNRKRHPCAACGAIHMRMGELCFDCDPAMIEPPARLCAICSSPIPREKGRASSAYCSSACSNAVGEARNFAMRGVAAAVKSGRLPPAKDCVCVDCGATACDYDHRHYLRPLDVVPVCRHCNLKRGSAEDVAEAVRAHFHIKGSLADFAEKRRKKEAKRVLRQLQRLKPIRRAEAA